MHDSNYIKIYSGDIILVQRIISELGKVDINAVVKDQNESGLDPKIYGGHSLQEIYVHKDELDKAVLVVEQITSELQN
ncbi:DUF2007 domain-containing protein [Flaviramulus sp. BrNp1-15]|uniref:putative signal transducing protein n=1 Tax=Flaviramulus sp. BrNp1-15 TaxID=2916754 RepID=UPI001EE93045|nr:DUF2007 domain-containing protein [Flaviramulus sp. BrNp1-15]ULC58070.1 DUF2007 domain-containing protein [Flaviramulus sp. BrNp1-15]